MTPTPVGRFDPSLCTRIDRYFTSTYHIGGRWSHSLKYGDITYEVFEDQVSASPHNLMFFWGCPLVNIVDYLKSKRPEVQLAARIEEIRTEGAENLKRRLEFIFAMYSKSARAEFLNATPEEAKEKYRATWLAWQEETDDERKRLLEGLMDDLQPKICFGPGPEWDAFSASLPGYKEYWNNLSVRAVNTLFTNNPDPRFAKVLAKLIFRGEKKS